MYKTVKVSNGYYIYDAYELRDGNYISTKIIDGPDKIINILNGGEFKQLKYYRARVVANVRCSDTGMLHEEDRDLSIFYNKEVYVRKNHHSGNTEIYSGYLFEDPTKFEYFTADEIELLEDTPTYNSNGEKRTPWK